MVVVDTVIINLSRTRTHVLTCYLVLDAPDTTTATLLHLPVTAIDSGSGSVSVATCYGDK